MINKAFAPIGANALFITMVSKSDFKRHGLRQCTNKSFKIAKNLKWKNYIVIYHIIYEIHNICFYLVNKKRHIISGTV